MIEDTRDEQCAVCTEPVSEDSDEALCTLHAEVMRQLRKAPASRTDFR